MMLDVATQESAAADVANPAHPLRTNILAALAKFVRQRPGFDWRNYYSDGRDKDGIAAYRADVRRAGRQLNDAEILLGTVRWRASITAHDLLQAAERAYSGRLSIKVDGERVELSYCAGQYECTEYRAAVCAVLAAALWEYWRPIHADKIGSTAQWVRDTARAELGRGIAQRWFS